MRGTFRDPTAMLAPERERAVLLEIWRLYDLESAHGQIVAQVLSNAKRFELHRRQTPAPFPAV